MEQLTLDFLCMREFDRLVADMGAADERDDVEAYYDHRADIVELARLNDAVADEARALGFNI